jgi:hypothetical protein
LPRPLCGETPSANLTSTGRGLPGCFGGLAAPALADAVAAVVAVVVAAAAAAGVVDGAVAAAADAAPAPVVADDDDDDDDGGGGIGFESFFVAMRSNASLPLASLLPGSAL